jgi:hypothetical protein
MGGMIITSGTVNFMNFLFVYRWRVDIDGREQSGLAREQGEEEEKEEELESRLERHKLKLI